VTAGRLARYLAACPPPATSNPNASEKIGFTSVITRALAAKTMAPAVGRTKVWMASLIWLTAGTLSAKNSIRESTTSRPIIHQLSSAFHGSLRLIRSVKREIRAITSSGI
jgi:hypothetical protein